MDPAVARLAAEERYVDRLMAALIAAILLRPAAIPTPAAPTTAAQPKACSAAPATSTARATSPRTSSTRAKAAIAAASQRATQWRMAAIPALAPISTPTSATSASAARPANQCMTRPSVAQRAGHIAHCALRSIPLSGKSPGGGGVCGAETPLVNYYQIHCC